MKYRWIVLFKLHDGVKFSQHAFPIGGAWGIDCHLFRYRGAACDYSTLTREYYQKNAYPNCQSKVKRIRVEF